MLGGEDPIQPITRAQFVKKISSGLLLHHSCFIFQFLEESNLHFFFVLVFVCLAAPES